MDFLISNPDLRKALDIGVLAHEHSGIVEDIRHKHPHQIQRVDPQPFHPDTAACLPAALDLTTRREYNIFAKEKQLFAGARFVRWLLHDAHLTQKAGISDGCLVIYFAGDEWKHAGKGVGTNRVISKWGTFLFFRHPIEQVPLEYGSIVRAYEHPGNDRAVQLFRDFVDACAQLPEWA